MTLPFYFGRPDFNLLQHDSAGRLQTQQAHTRDGISQNTSRRIVAVPASQSQLIEKE